MSRILIVTACALLLGGCGLSNAIGDYPAKQLYQGGAIFIGADLISLASTKKTIDDHVVGMIYDEDCSTLRASHGGPWCEPNPAPVAMIDQTSYCYQSLAKATCYTQPDPTEQAMFLGTRTVQVPAP